MLMIFGFAKGPDVKSGLKGMVTGMIPRNKFICLAR
jgi:hypothetical protein